MAGDALAVEEQLRARRGLEAYITTNMFWDIGKVLFAWCVFWAYLMWSQYLPIWYANMPEETGYFIHRLTPAWKPVSAFLMFGKFFVPVNVVMTLIEELAKPLSLALRLFGDLFAGELVFLLIALIGGTMAVGAAALFWLPLQVVLDSQQLRDHLRYSVDKMHYYQYLH